MNTTQYVLITAARNEEAYIEKTIQSVICQTILPVKWVIVDDNSSDRTYEIISEYAMQHSFIEPVHLERSNEWSFKSKANAINYGYEYLRGIDYEYIGILDADVSFDDHYYQNIFLKFSQSIKLGIAGGMIVELQNGRYTPLNYNLNSVSGAVQLFHRNCYEEIGGYVPSKRGGIDAIAEIMSRMFGWQVRSSPEIRVYHHRRIGLTHLNIISSRFHYGQRDYAIGYDPLFMFLKCINRFQEKPYVIGGILMMVGYGWSWIQKETRPVSQNVVAYLKKEQRDRMLSTIFKKRKIQTY